MKPLDELDIANLHKAAEKSKVWIRKPAEPGGMEFNRGCFDCECSQADMAAEKLYMTAWIYQEDSYDNYVPRLGLILTREDRFYVESYPGHWIRYAYQSNSTDFLTVRRNWIDSSQIADVPELYVRATYDYQTGAYDHRNRRINIYDYVDDGVDVLFAGTSAVNIYGWYIAPDITDPLNIAPTVEDMLASSYAEDTLNSIMNPSGSSYSLEPLHKKRTYGMTSAMQEALDAGAIEQSQIQAYGTMSFTTELTTGTSGNIDFSSSDTTN